KSPRNFRQAGPTKSKGHDREESLILFRYISEGRLIIPCVCLAVWVGSHAGLTSLGAHSLDQRNAKLLSSIPADHARNAGFFHVCLRKHLDRVPGARGIVVRIAGAPYDFSAVAIRQLANSTLIGVKPQHNVALVPHLFGI